MAGLLVRLEKGQKLVLETGTDAIELEVVEVRGSRSVAVRVKAHQRWDIIWPKRNEDTTPK